MVKTFYVVVVDGGGVERTSCKSCKEEGTVLYSTYLPIVFSEDSLKLLALADLKIETDC
jgi:hypothetical protein